MECVSVGGAIVKLHSELANPTESQLDRVGVDFVFPPSQVTNNKNPHQNLQRRKFTTDLKFGI